MRRIAEKILSFLAPYLGWLILWFVTLTSRLIVVGRERIKPGSILASWHSSFSLPVFILRKLHLTCIVSPSEDGLLLERFLLLSGCKVIRGSTRRGGLTALRKASEELKKGEILGITPDGPLGPPRVPHKGVLFLAREGHPLIPVGVSAHPAIRLKTWDRHLLPLPFSRIVVSFGEPILLRGRKEEMDIIRKAIDKEERNAEKLLKREVNSLWGMLLPILLYNIAIFLLLPLILFYLFHRELKGKHMRGWKERFGFVPKSQGGIWFHAVSVGEVMAVKPIIEIISSHATGKKIYLSTITNTGRETANKHLSSLTTIFFFPFDILPFPFIALRRLKPSLLCLVETEIWPNLIFLARLMNIPIVLVNGRISDKSLLSLRALRFFFAPFLRQINLLMQSERDAKRVEMCGGTNVKVLGNTKFDQVSGLRSAERLEGLRRALGISEYEDVLLAGSTHPGEEEKVLRAYWDIRLSYPDLRLIIAPRHPERIPQVEALLAKQGFSFVRRSSLPSLTLDPHAIILIDTVGELSTLYGLSTVSFVGGSLVPIGGHNILEPFVWGKPALFGPYMNNFRDIAELAKREGVGIEVRNEKELGEKIKLLLSLPSWRKEIEEKALALIERMRGAGHRYADFILQLLEEHKNK
jgi:3-deoxy-D-manno-octulosonic-acid transferase